MTVPGSMGLSFPSLDYGTHETPLDLTPFLFKGGAKHRKEIAAERIRNSALGDHLSSRLPLVKRLHDQISGAISKGASQTTIANMVRDLRLFVIWCDSADRSLTLDSAISDFTAWTEALLHRVRVEKSISHETAYAAAQRVDGLLSPVLDVSRGLLRNTRLRYQQKKKRVLGTQADKQSLADTFEFGHVIFDIASALTIDAVVGPLPVEIALRRGQVLGEWAGAKSDEMLERARVEGDVRLVNQYEAERAIRQADKSLSRRYPLVNLRIECELLIFLSQTGMNLTQGHRLKRGPFRFQSAGDEVEVFREYKGRRGGEVEFRIFKAYRRHFEKYREWIDHFVPADEDPRLFPFIYPTKIPAIDSPPRFQSIQRRCKAIGLKFVGSQKLRRTRVNWLLRRTQDPELTADEAQHTKQTLLKVYEEPNHHLAAREITTFFKLTDPSIDPPGPGACVDVHRRPESVPGKPLEAPAPDCASPAGCLFCVFHRDLDTEDYVWNLASYRYLKTIELSFYKPPDRNAPAHPAAAVINRITAKLEHLRTSSEVRALWVREAEDRVAEGVHHAHWDGFIQLMEISK